MHDPRPARAPRALILKCSLLVAALLGCAEEIVGPPITLDPGATPGVVCNAADTENRDLQTRVVLRAAMGGSFAPLPVGVLTLDASLAVPAVALRAADGSEVAVRQVEFVTPREMALWVTRTTRDGGPIAPGLYTVVVTNPDGQRGLTQMGALRVEPPPTVTGVARVDPTVPAAGVDADEGQTVCNGYTTVLAVAGTRFRPADPAPVVEVVDARGAVVRRVADDDVRVLSTTELRVTLRAPIDPARRLAPGRYGLRVTNPDGTVGTSSGAGDGGVGDAGDGGAPGERSYPQGCRATAPSLFNVVPPPEVRAVEPVSACSSREQRFVVRGAHFRRGITPTIVGPTPYVVPAANVAYASTAGSANDFDSLTLTVPRMALPPGGGYALTVRNADACAVTFEPQCPSGTMPTGAPNECQGMVGMASGTGPRTITFYPDPVVTGIEPTGLCTAALVPVTITGMHFHATYGVQPIVRVNNVELANVRVTSPTTLTAEIPATLMPGTPLGTPYDVTVTVPEGCSGSRAMTLTLFPPPTLTGVAPASVCVDRPTTTLTLTGTNFHAFEGRLPTVTLGTTPPTTLGNVRVVSPTSLTAEVPSSTPPGGPYDVTVTSPVRCAVTLPRAFTYWGAPTITGVVTQASCTGGNPVLALTGTGFHATGTTLPTVTVAGVTLAGVRVSSSTTLLAELPTSLAAGSYTARVTMPEGCAVDSPMFSYNPGALVTPRLVRVLPTRGWSGVDTPITVVGEGLATLSSLSLRGAGASGDLALTDISVVSGDILTATVPSGGRAGGPYDLISTVAGCPLTLPNAFSVSAAPSITITRVSPAFGWTSASTPVVVEGMGFQSTPRLYVIVPSLTPRLRPLARPVFVDASTVAAVVPAGLPPGTYDVAAINPDGGGGVIRGAFRVTMNPPPTIATVSPGAGTTQTPTTVTITGQNFRTPEVTLRNAAGASFTGTVTAGTGTSLTVRLPTNTTPIGAYVVRVRNPDEGTFADFGSFVVTNPAEKLGPFMATSPLTVARRGAAAVTSRVTAVSRFLYAIGGDGGASGPTHDSVEFAPVDLFGQLGTWRAQRYRLPAGITSVAAAAVEQGGHLYLVGGATAMGAPRAEVLHAKVLDFSTAPVIADPEATRVRTGGLAPGAWLYRVAAVMSSTDRDNPGGETLPSDQVTALFIFNSTVRLRWGAVPGAASYRVYRSPMVDGASGSETLIATVTSETTWVDDGTATPRPAGIDNQPLALGSTGVWTTRRTLSTARLGACAAVAPDPAGNLFLYALVGRGSSGPLASYEYAALSADGGTLGPFTTGAASFPTSRDHAACAVANPQSAPGVTAGSFVYVTGGFGGGGSLRSTEFGRVAAGGSLLSLTDTNSYSRSRGGASAIIVNGDYYVMGGTTGASLSSPALDSTNLSTLQASGAPAASFPNAVATMLTARQNFGLSLASAYFFLVGGSSTGTNALTSVERTIY